MCELVQTLDVQSLTAFFQSPVMLHYLEEDCLWVLWVFVCTCESSFLGFVDFSAEFITELTLGGGCNCNNMPTQMKQGLIKITVLLIVRAVFVV